jgi:signal transduction histidine kinase
LKIRTQFYLLISGIVVVPLIIAVGFYYAQRMRESSAPKVPGYEEISRLAGESVDRASWEGLSNFMEHKPKTMEFTILDKGRHVLFSTIAQHKVGDVLSDELLLSLIRETSGDYLYQLDAPVRTGEGRLLVLTRILREAQRPLSPYQKLFGTFIAFLFALLVFSSTMCILIARSITESVMVLEATTRRIAAGDLDFPIEVRGSNEITSLTTSLTSMRDALKDDQTRRSRFIMGVTHDLKTPLALIKGYAEAIGDGMAEGPGARDQYVGIIGAKVDQLDGMVDDLIDFVRMDTAEWRRRLEPVGLALFLRGFARRVEADALLLHRRTESDIDIPSGLTVPMDERLVVRALENIVNNALRYTSEGGLVRLSALVVGGCAVLRISDNGPGISEEDLPHIFDMFYRGTGSRREQGMGLGLSIVRGVVDSHGWTITVSSKKGEGSTFEVTIPLTAGAAAK